MKTTLCTVLLSLTSVSMIACSGPKSSNGEKSSGIQLTEKATDTLEDRLDKVQADLAIAKSERNQLILTSDTTAMSVKYAENEYNEIVEIAVNSGNTADLNKITSYKAALDDAKAEDSEVSKKVNGLNIEISSLELLEKKYKAQIRVRDNNELLPSVINVSEIGATKIKEAIAEDEKVIAKVEAAFEPKSM